MFPNPLLEGITRGLTQGFLNAVNDALMQLIQDLLDAINGALMQLMQDLLDSINRPLMQSMRGLLDGMDIQSTLLISMREIVGLPAEDEECTIVQVHEEFSTTYIEHRTPQVHLHQKLQFNKQLLIKWVKVGWDWVAIVQRICWVGENVLKWLS